MLIPAEDDDKTIEALKKLRAIYRTAYAKLDATRAANLKALTDPLTVRLKALEADLTKRDRVPDAKVVRDYQEAIAAGEKTSSSAPVVPTPGTKNGTTSGMPLPEFSGGSSWRKAAEWVISLGGTVEVMRDDKTTRTQKMDELPSGRFDIVGVELENLIPVENRQRVTDEGLALLAGQKEMRTLRFYQAPITDAGLSILRNFPKLKTLWVNSCKGVTSEGIKQLKNPSFISALYLTGSSVDLGLMGDLKEFSSLGDLEVGGLTLTPGASKWISGLSKLSRLSAIDCKGVTKETMADFKKMPNLTHLLLQSAPNVTDDDMADIGTFTQLSELSLPRDVTDKTLLEVVKLPRLSSLALVGEKGVTDMGLASLKDAKALTSLELRGLSSITVAGLISLKNVKTLTRLILSQMSSLTVTDTVVADLQKALPDAKITRN